MFEEKLRAYAALVSKWNTVYNLTAAKTSEEVYQQHILDSLTVLPYLYGEDIVDVGSGAGFPGIPLAIVEPQKRFTLIDSRSKRTRFLQQAVVELGLKNVTLVNQRVENFQPESCYTSILTRAFSHLANMLEKTSHLCCNDGRFLAMKGQQPDAEIAQLKLPKGLCQIISLTSDISKIQRHLVIIRKPS